MIFLKKKKRIRLATEILFTSSVEPQEEIQNGARLRIPGMRRTLRVGSMDLLLPISSVPPISCCSPTPRAAAARRHGLPLPQLRVLQLLLASRRHKQSLPQRLALRTSAAGRRRCIPNGVRVGEKNRKPQREIFRKEIFREKTRKENTIEKQKFAERKYEERLNTKPPRILA